MTRRAPLQLALIALLAALAFHPAPVGAQEADGLVLVLNARNPTQSIDKAEIKRLFLGQTSFWHGVVPIRLFVRADQSAPAKMFYPKALDMTPASYHEHWNKLQLSGRAVAPTTIGSAEELARKVASVPGGLGFALASETWNLQVKGVKYIEVK